MSLTKIKKIVGDGLLEQGRFGRSEVPAIWVESKTFLQIAEELASDPEVALDWLENLSAMEMDGDIALSYFLRSHTTEARLVLRVSSAPDSAQARVEFSSAVEIWPASESFEGSIEELFGVTFHGPSEDRALTTGYQLAPGSQGFPMRKSFVFAKYMGPEVGS